MPYKVTVQQNNLGPEGEVQVNGLGSLKNGKTYKVSDETAALFEILQGVPLIEADMHGITVTVAEKTEGSEN